LRSIKAKRRVNPIYIYIRKLRILKQGVWYEIRTQINNREPLFRESNVREIFNRVLRETELRFVFKVCCLRLEDDELRCYIRPEDGLELPAIMKWLKQTFAQRYNRETGRTGHIWGDRYWSRVVEGEPQENEENGAAATVANTGVRPHRGKNERAPGFPHIPPFLTAPAPG
jgi:REP element-mobilizing transposase RayT